MARTIPPYLRDLRRLPCRLAPSGKIPLIGVLRPVAADDPHTEAFRQGLRELGYVEGHNVRMAYRFAEGRFERLPTLADEWVRLPVDVRVTDGPGALAARQATDTIPIVFAVLDQRAHPCKKLRFESIGQGESRKINGLCSP